MRNECFEHCLSHFVQISLHKLFSLYVMTYATAVGGGILNEESKTFVITLSVYYTPTCLM